jgi:hypothetical protein
MSSALCGQTTTSISLLPSSARRSHFRENDATIMWSGYKKHAAHGIPPWSPSGVLTVRDGAYLPNSRWVWGHVPMLWPHVLRFLSATLLIPRFKLIDCLRRRLSFFNCSRDKVAAHLHNRGARVRGYPSSPLTSYRQRRRGSCDRGKLYALPSFVYLSTTRTSKLV